MSGRGDPMSVEMLSAIDEVVRLRRQRDEIQEDMDTKRQRLENDHSVRYMKALRQRIVQKLLEFGSESEKLDDDIELMSKQLNEMRTRRRDIIKNARYLKQYACGLRDAQHDWYAGPAICSNCDIEEKNCVYIKKMFMDEYPSIDDLVSTWEPMPSLEGSDDEEGP